MNKLSELYKDILRTTVKEIKVCLAAITIHIYQFSLSSEFAKEKSRQTKSGKFQKIREKHLVDEAVKGYLDWIQQAGNFFCVFKIIKTP